jgi:bifunctional non-homologous end joining protein LigD
MRRWRPKEDAMALPKSGGARRRAVDTAGTGSLERYREMRHFDETPEPRGRRTRRKGRVYIIQKHAASRLHYDFRLELDGVLKSWAVTRGPSLDPAQKRLAVRTEDHPVDYARFEGTITEGHYGAGTVMLWDRGSWEPVGDPHEGLERGKLVFRLDGERLKGRWALVRFRGGRDRRSDRENWLLIKELDDEVDRESDVLARYGTSVATDRSLEEIAMAKAAKRSARAAAKRTAVR